MRLLLHSNQEALNDLGMTKDKVVKALRPPDRRELEWPMMVKMLQLSQTLHRLLNHRRWMELCSGLHCIMKKMQRAI